MTASSEIEAIIEAALERAKKLEEKIKKRDERIAALEWQVSSERFSRKTSRSALV